MIFGARILDRLRRTPRVSVIVPIYNAAPYLLECLESISAQTLRRIEVICVDDCSSDDSYAIAAGFAARDRRFRVCRAEKHLGAGACRNRGLEVASGQYVQLTDADDILPANALAILFRLAISDNACVVRGGIASFPEREISLLAPLDLPPRRNRYRLIDEPHLWVPWWTTTFLYSRMLLIEHGIAYPSLADGEDAVFLAKVLTRAKVISSTDVVVYHYRGLNHQRSNVSDTLKHLEMVKKIFLDYNADCWFEGYGKFMRDKIIPQRIRTLHLSPSAAEDLTAKLDEMCRRA